MNKYYRKFKRSSKALSPVIASIILIAVTVAVSVVVAAWMGGMTIGLMGNTEQVSITNIAFLPVNSVGGSTTNDTIVVQLQNSGGSSSAVISTAYLNGASVSVTASPTSATAPAPIPKNTAGSVAIQLPAGALVAGTEYTVKLITAKGTQISSSNTYSP